MTAAHRILAAIGGVLRTRRPELSADDIDDLAGSITDSVLELLLDESPFGPVTTRNIHVSEGVSPADVARVVQERIDYASVPSVPPAASGNGRDGKVTERDRFLDEGNDRRCAMQAAARIATTGNVNAVASDYRSILGILRQGKEQA